MKAGNFVSFMLCAINYQTIFNFNQLFKEQFMKGPPWWASQMSIQLQTGGPGFEARLSKHRHVC